MFIAGDRDHNLLSKVKGNTLALGQLNIEGSMSPRASVLWFASVILHVECWLPFQIGSLSMLS